MTTLTCPHCAQPIDVFPPVSAERSLWSGGVTRLAGIPLDPTLTTTNDGLPHPVYAALAETISHVTNEP